MPSLPKAARRTIVSRASWKYKEVIVHRVISVSSTFHFIKLEKHGKFVWKRVLQMRDFFVKSHSIHSRFIQQVFWNEKWLSFRHEFISCPSDPTTNFETTNCNFHYVFYQLERVRSLTVFSCLYICGFVGFFCQKQFDYLTNSWKFRICSFLGFY